MKSVLISVRPKWCEPICNLIKTVEVRKDKPKCEVPFKCLIYCTKPTKFYKISSCMRSSNEYLHLCENKVTIGNGFNLWDKDYKVLNGKVIGEFVCDSISEYVYEQGEEVGEMMYYISTADGEKTGLTYEEFADYGKGKTLYGWHISDLKIYDKPRELGEFYSLPTKCRSDCKEENPMQFCSDCKRFKANRKITRPPQSWCYVESEVEQLKADGRMVYQIGCVFAKKHKDLVLQIIETKFDFSLLCQIGKTVFLTLPEAEQALKEMEGK